MLIQKLRLQRGWSQQQLADLSGLSTRTIQRLENGQPASIESLKSLAAVFEVDFHTLQGEPAMSPAIPVPVPAAATPLSASPLPPDTIPTASASREEEEAFRHVRKMRSFYRSVVIYLLVMALLTAINLLTYRNYLWVVWPALGWGLGLCIKGLKTFDFLPFGPEWEKHQVEKRLGRKL